ncbi:hypothetical protein [Bacteroides sp.]
MTNDEENPEEVLRRKEEVVRYLIEQKDEIIDRELRRYEGAAFYIRLQSECFNLYPLLVRLLARKISSMRCRYIFKGIVNGKDIHEIAGHLSITTQEVGVLFVSTVHTLGNRMREIYNVALEYDALKKKYEEHLQSQRDEEKRDKTFSQQIRCLQNHNRILNQRCREEEQKVEKLHQKQRDKEQERWRMKARIFYLEHRMDELTHQCDGFWARLKWLWKGR